VRPPVRSHRGPRGGPTACGGDDSDGSANPGDCTPPDTPRHHLRPRSTVRRARVYGKIISAFQSKWKEEHGDQQVIFQESYGGSTTQAQNIVNGFEATSWRCPSLPDVDYIADAG